MKKILVHTRTPEQARFFFRIENELSDYLFEYFTTNLLTKLFLVLNNKKSFVLRDKKSNLIKIPNKDFLTGEGFCKCPEKVYTETYMFLKSKKWDAFFVWNGLLPSEKAFSEISNNNILYFEIGNFKNKVFIDQMGTNKNSSIFFTRKKLKWDKRKEKDYIEWKRDYIKEKENQKSIPQAKKKFMKNFFIKSIKYVSKKIEKKLNILSDQELDIKYMFKILRPNVVLKKKKNKIKEEYIFFPMQVSNDSQILLNSIVSIEAALKYVVKQGIKEKTDVVIKLHPAEQDISFIKKIILFCEKNNIYISNENTYELIKNAKKIITINSTVGLEAKILEKEVEFLGESFYQRFNDDELKAYLIDFLQEANYFGKDKIPLKTIECIRQKLEGKE